MHDKRSVSGDGKNLFLQQHFAASDHDVRTCFPDEPLHLRSVRAGGMEDWYIGADLWVKALDVGEFPLFPKTVCPRQEETVVDTESCDIQEPSKPNPLDFPAELTPEPLARVVENDDSNEIGKRGQPPG